MEETSQEHGLLKALKSARSIYDNDITKWEELGYVINLIKLEIVELFFKQMSLHLPTSFIYSSNWLIKVGMFYESLQNEAKAELFFREALQLWERHLPSSAVVHIILANTLSYV